MKYGLIVQLSAASIEGVRETSALDSNKAKKGYGKRGRAIGTAIEMTAQAVFKHLHWSHSDKLIRKFQDL
ncbi:unnamed protein product [Litomosoides sigmodontis]|uniref:Uncharacterized protein n=1 Tax=Litomosoides sigmodontis TaxID=42156 RepID=A0A3P6UQ02_LITSI|nr:unnamed protein product [Litomosoides sigmodontis]